MNNKTDYLIVKIVKNLIEIQRIEALFHQRRFTLNEYLILYTIEKEGPVKPSQVADELKFSRGAISRQTDRLIQQKYLVTIPTENDRRSHRLILTDLGRDLLLDLSHLLVAHNEKA